MRWLVFVGPGRVFDKALFTARFARDAEGAEKRPYSVRAVKIVAAHIRTQL